MGDHNRQESAVRFGFYRYRRHMAILLIALAGYACIAESARLPLFRLIPRTSGELFPFFNWSLFSQPWRYSRRYTILPLAVSDDSAFKLAVGRPLEFREAVFLRDIRFQKASFLVHSRLLSNPKSTAHDGAVLLDNFIKPLGIKAYQLIRIKYDPLIRDGDNLVDQEMVVELRSSLSDEK